MALVLRRSQLGAKALRSLLGRESCAVAESLRDRRLPVERRVHQVRRRIKRLRALLRLLRKPLGRKARAELNGRLRVLARRLALLRETDVHPLSLATLFGNQSGAELRQLSAALRAHCLALRASIEDPEALLELTAAELTGLTEAIPPASCWGPVGERRLLEAFFAAYLKACQALVRARRSGSADDFHYWRRRVKDHQYQLALLRRVLPDAAAARRREVEALAELLGQVNDYDELDAVLAELDPDAAGPALTRARALLVTELARLRHRALAAGRRLFTPESGLEALFCGPGRAAVRS